jgi:hypothetical protein
MTYVHIDYQDLDLFVRFYQDGEPEGIYAFHGRVRKQLPDGTESIKDSYTEITHLFTEGAAERIFDAALEQVKSVAEDRG